MKSGGEEDRMPPDTPRASSHEDRRVSEGGGESGRAIADGGVESVPVERPACSAEAARMITACSDGMRERRHSKRERIALGVFSLLLFVGAIALFSYINAGHGLNVAATSIDDMAGDMSGYGVILFEGTVDPQGSDDSEEEGGVQGLLSGIFGQEDAESEVSDKSSSSSADLYAGTSGRSSDGAVDSSASAKSAGSGIGSSRLGPSVSSVTVEEAERVYREKGASTIVVDPSDLDAYSSGRIIMQGGRTYGIFSLTSDDLSDLPYRNATTTRTTTTTTKDAAGSLTTNTTTRVRSAYGSVSEIFESVDPEDISPDLVERIESMLEHFKECGVDTVIALTSDPTPFCAIEGVDVVVTFKQDDRFSMSETIDGTMYFDAPEVGQVGVLMVAPGNVVSAKVMKGE